MHVLRLFLRTRGAPLPLFLALVIAGLGNLRGADGETVESVHRVALEWARIQEERHRIETEWRHERDLLEGTARALQERIKELESKQRLIEERTALIRADAVREKEQNAALSQSVQTLSERLQHIGNELLGLRPMLPPRLDRALEFAFAGLEDESRSPGDRMQTLITIFNRCAEFNSTITLSEEALAVENSAERVMEVLYWGLAQAYALDRDGNRAYVGRPTKAGWVWEPRSEAASTIATAIAAYRDEVEPRFAMLRGKVTEIAATPGKTN